jgi:ArsR family transcriptional regulator
LRRGQECVCHLTTLFDKPQPYVSQQLSVLRKAGIIEDEKDGLNVYYRLVDEDVAGWLTQILGQPEGEHPELTPQKKLLCPCPQCEVEIQLV